MREYDPKNKMKIIIVDNDYRGNYRWYHNEKVQPKWVKDYTKVSQIGDHIIYTK